MLETAFQALGMVLAWPAIGYLMLGVVIGLYFGAVPGLSGLVGMAILLPFTFSMEPIAAFAFLLGMYAVTTTSDTIASVLLGIPGTAASQATILDGYPMAVKGEAARAFGAAFTVSAIGGVIGGLFLALSIPIVRPLIMSFAMPEFFMLGLLGLTMVGALSGGSMVKGLLAATIGLLVAMVGYDQNGGVPRYTFDIVYILEGLPLIPVVLGLFALPEVIDLAVRNTSISQIPKEQARGGILTGVRDAMTHWWLALRCTAIGMYVGLLPGLGGSIVDWVAYGHAVQSARDKDGFGKGDVRGVIAPESANNAMKGGALIPTVAFGIPGSAPMAILLGAFLIHGLTPGPEMLTTKLDITFSLVWTLIIANLLGAGLLMVLARQIAKVTFIKGHLIIPFIGLFVFMGAWLSGNNIGDWITLLAFGLLGYLMKRGALPRPPLVLGMVLGPIMENSLYITTESYGPVAWMARPVCIVIGALVVATLIYMAISNFRRRKRDDVVKVAESDRTDPFVGILLIGGCFTLAVWGLAHTTEWSIETRLFPLTALIPMALLALGGLVQEGRNLKTIWASVSGRAGTRFRAISVVWEERHGVLAMFGWLGGIVLASMAIGQIAAIPLFMAAYIIIWGRYSWRLALLYAAIGAGFLYLMFEEMIAVVWYNSWLFG